MKLWSLKLKIAGRSVLKLLLRPLYLILAFVIATLLLGLLLWLFNLPLLGSYLFDSGQPLGDKISFSFAIFRTIPTSLLSFETLAMLAISVLAGINTMLLVFVLRQRTKSNAKSGVAGLAAGVIGAGCAACGTSLLAPIITAAGATATLTLVNTIGIVANLVGIGLLFYSIYKLGGQAATYLAS